MLDNALAFDLATRRCDLVFDGVDLALDDTPATPLLISLGCNRRARTDDMLPDGATDFFAPGSMLSRQGWVGDAFDASGQLIGSRFWLLDGAKGAARVSTTTGPGELTRRRSEGYAVEACKHFRDQGYAVGVTARWDRPGGLAVTVVVGKTELTVRRVLS